ncbi:MAG: hypothetical protein Q4G63_10625 [Bacteroidia bacterium]|nr:hypothetical protein [Bacteroidia bacterium]
MKKILFLLLTIAIAFASCDPKPEIDKGKLDPNATITIRPAKGVKVRATVKGLTALEVVQQATSIHYHSHYFDNRYEETAKDISRGFREDMKDFDTPALKMLGIDVIAATGEYYRDLTYAKNVYIVREGGDTIAYIPDEVINAARPLIEAAYEAENYTEVYRLFDTAFTFKPIE